MTPNSQDFFPQLTPGPVETCDVGVKNAGLTCGACDMFGGGMPGLTTGGGPPGPGGGPDILWGGGPPGGGPETDKLVVQNIYKES